MSEVSRRNSTKAFTIVRPYMSLTATSVIALTMWRPMKLFPLEKFINRPLQHNLDYFNSKGKRKDLLSSIYLLVQLFAIICSPLSQFGCNSGNAENVAKEYLEIASRIGSLSSGKLSIEF